ncbi:MAG TPA: Mpo1-like protein, partial [Dokdonella sp.]
MRSVEDWFASYSADHRHPTNVVIHWICVPAILWAA